MEDCTVSITGDDGRIYTLDVKASILFDAVHQAAQTWAVLWWYRGAGIVGVRAGARRWRVRLERVRRWREGQVVKN